eukprot:gene10871-11025_t
MRRSLKQFLDMFGTETIGAAFAPGLFGNAGLLDGGGMGSLSGLTGGWGSSLGGTSIGDLAGLSMLTGGVGGMAGLAGISQMGKALGGPGNKAALNSMGNMLLSSSFGSPTNFLAGGGGSGLDLARQAQYNNAASTLSNSLTAVKADQFNAAQRVHGTVMPIAQNAAQTMGPIIHDAMTHGAGDAAAGMAQAAGNAVNTMRPFLQAHTNQAANTAQQAALAANQVASSTLVPMAYAKQAAAKNMGAQLSQGFNQGFNEGFTAAMERREPYADAAAKRSFYTNQPAVFLPQTFVPLGSMANITYPCPLGPGNSIAPAGTIIGPGIPCGVVLQMVPRSAVPKNAMAPTVVRPTPVSDLVPAQPSPSPSPVPIPTIPIGPGGGGGGGDSDPITGTPPVIPPIQPPIINPSPAPGIPGGGGLTPPIINPSPVPGAGGGITPPVVLPSPAPAGPGGITQPIVRPPAPSPSTRSFEPRQPGRVSVTGPYTSILEAAAAGGGTSRYSQYDSVQQGGMSPTAGSLPQGVTVSRTNPAASAGVAAGVSGGSSSSAAEAGGVRSFLSNLLGGVRLRLAGGRRLLLHSTNKQQRAC